jgi:hypothetical protein
MSYLPKPPENLTFSDDNCDSDEDHEQQGGDSVEYGPTLKQVVLHLNSIYQQKEILTMLSVI